MRLYRWYRKFDVSIVDTKLDIMDRYPLYAFTTDKKIRKIFNKTRNPNAFIEFSDKVSKEEFVEFAKHRQDHMLDYHRYNYYTYKDQTLHDIDVITTQYEFDVVDMITENGLIEAVPSNKFSSIELVSVLRPEYITTLKQLMFIQVAYYNEGFGSTYIDKFLEDIGCLEMPEILLGSNTFNILIDNFSDTFRSSTE